MPSPQSSPATGEGARRAVGEVAHSASPSPATGAGARHAVGEVVEASTTGFAAQCHRLYESPPLGALVRAGAEDPIYGVVAEITTQSIDPGRRPMALGAAEGTTDAVYRNNPQLARLLSTDFRAIAVGHASDGQLRRYLAPLPPRIHERVYLCDPEEVREVSGSLDLLALLLAAPFGSPDDMTASFLRQASAAHGDPERFMVEAGKEVAGLLGVQIQRLNGLLRRLSS